MRLAGTLFLVLAAAAQVRTLQDGTPVRLRLNRTVSSANAHVGETVDFEITDPVINQNYVVIPKGAVALGRAAIGGVPIGDNIGAHGHGTIDESNSQKQNQWSMHVSVLSE